MMAATAFFLFHGARIKEMPYGVSAIGHIFFDISDTVSGLDLVQCVWTRRGVVPGNLRQATASVR